MKEADAIQLHMFPEAQEEIERNIAQSLSLSGLTKLAACNALDYAHNHAKVIRRNLN
jgi:hypothetical protein